MFYIVEIIVIEAVNRRIRCFFVFFVAVDGSIPVFVGKNWKHFFLVVEEAFDLFNNFIPRKIFMLSS